MKLNLLSKTFFGETYVAALQTTYLSKVLEIFKPNQIRKLIAEGEVKKGRELKTKDLIGLKYIREDYDKIVIDYDCSNVPRLTEESIKEIIELLKKTGVNDCTISCLEVDNLNVDFGKYGAKLNNGLLAKSTEYVGRFRNDLCPNNTRFREDIKKKNYEIYKSSRNLFRYRQLQLYYFILKKQLELVSYQRRKPIIDLELNWHKKSGVPKTSGEGLSSQETVRAIQDCIGDYWCSSLGYRLTKDRHWMFVGTT